jgi:hypothetical protein
MRLPHGFGILRAMAKRDRDTIENRVYLFDSLAGQFIAASAERLCSGKEDERQAALRALADLAWVSCVVSDTGALDANGVRARLLEGAPTAPATKAPKAKGPGKRSRAS